MSANFLHGVETIQVDIGPRPVKVVKSAVIGMVVTAAAGPVNTPVLITNERDFAQFGEDIPGSTARDAFEAIFAQKGTVCVVVNVLDPAIHKTSVTDEVVTLGVDNTFKLSHAAVNNVVVKNMAGGTTYGLTDYTLDARTGKGTRANGGTIAASTLAVPSLIKVSYDYADPTKVLPGDVIGTITGAGARTGIKAFADGFALFGFYPKILIAPVFSALASVSAALISMAHQIRGVTPIQAPIGITPQQAITGRGPAGAINFNTSSERALLCYPHAKAFDAATNTEQLYPLATYVAGLISRKDQENGYHWSPSNTEILGITGIERPIYAMINDANSEANLLNEAGIITVFNSFGTGYRLWGNRSAAWPSVSHPKNFINILRTGDIIDESIEYFMLQFIDRPLDNALIDAVVESVNAFMRKLIGEGVLLGGRCWFDPALNTKEALAAGQVAFSRDFMPPTPMERATFYAMVNIDYLSLLGKKAA